MNRLIASKLALAAGSLILSRAAPQTRWLVVIPVVQAALSLAQAGKREDERRQSGFFGAKSDGSVSL